MFILKKCKYVRTQCTSLAVFSIIAPSFVVSFAFIALVQVSSPPQGSNRVLAGLAKGEGRGQKREAGSPKLGERKIKRTIE